MDVHELMTIAVLEFHCKSFFRNRSVVMVTIDRILISVSQSVSHLSAWLSNISRQLLAGIWYEYSQSQRMVSMDDTLPSRTTIRTIIFGPCERISKWKVVSWTPYFSSVGPSQLVQHFHRKQRIAKYKQAGITFIYWAPLCSSDPFELDVSFWLQCFHLPLRLLLMFQLKAHCWGYY